MQSTVMKSTLCQDLMTRPSRYVRRGREKGGKKEKAREEAEGGGVTIGRRGMKGRGHRYVQQ